MMMRNFSPFLIIRDVPLVCSDFPLQEFRDGQDSSRVLPLALLLLRSRPAALKEQPQCVFLKHQDCWEVLNSISLLLLWLLSADLHVCRASEW